MANKKCQLAIDIGASGGRHVVGILEGKNREMVEVYRFSNQIDKTDGHLLWDVDRLWNEIKKGIMIASGQYPEIQSIGIDTWGVDYVLLDGEKVLFPVFAYRDQRTKTASRKVHEVIPFEHLYQRTGCQFQEFNTIYQLYDDLLSGRLANATDFLMLPEYFYWKLTGKKFHEYTNATTTGLVSSATKEYDQELVSALGLPSNLFGQLTQPGHREPLSVEMKKELNIRAEVVLVATHDTASAVEGVDIPNSSLYLSTGTWSLLGVKVEKPILSSKAIKANFTNEGGVGYIRFQKNIMGLWIIQELKKELNISTFQEMVNMARFSSYSETFNVNRKSLLSPKSMIQEIEKALRSSHKQPPITEGSIINSVFHSLAKAYHEAISEIESLTKKTYDTIHVFGGGAKNQYLNSLIETYTKKKIIVYPIEATAIGNIKIQEEAFK